MTVRSRPRRRCSPSASFAPPTCPASATTVPMALVYALARLEPRGQLGAFAHRPLGVQLAGFPRAADEVAAAHLAPRVLAGADDDGVGGDDAFLAVDANVHTLFVDAQIGHFLQH